MGYSICTRRASAKLATFAAIFFISFLVLLMWADRADAIIWLPGEEVTVPGSTVNGRYQGDKWHLIATNVWSHTSTGLSLQDQIDTINAKGGGAILPHPYANATSSAPGFSYTTLKSVTGALGVELTKLYDNTNYSSRYWGWDYGGTWSPLYTHYWGAHATPFWGFRNPDIDHPSEPNTLRSATVVRAATLSRAALLQSMRRGDFYTVRAGAPISAWTFKSFPVPQIDPVAGTIKITARPGMSIRMFKAASNTPLTLTCNYTNPWGPQTYSRDVCAMDKYWTSATYNIQGGESYVKIIAGYYLDTRYPSAMYQPIFIRNDGIVAYNPYAPVSPDAGNKYLGSIHVHSRVSKDAPDGLAPADLLAWFKNKGWDFLSVTDHNFVTTDFVKPKAHAPSKRTVYANNWVRLYFMAEDNKSAVKFVVVIKKASTGKTVKTIFSGWKRSNTWYSASWKAEVSRGTYYYAVYTRDGQLNDGTVAKNYIYVK